MSLGAVCVKRDLKHMVWMRNNLVVVNLADALHGYLELSMLSVCLWLQILTYSIRIKLYGSCILPFVFLEDWVISSLINEFLQNHLSFYLIWTFFWMGVVNKYFLHFFLFSSLYCSVFPLFLLISIDVPERIAVDTGQTGYTCEL
jgi:hypothetical protein